MVLKEAFRYQNYLGSLLSAAQSYLYNSNNMTIKTQEHMRKKSNPEAEDETTILPKQITLEIKPNVIIDFALNIINQKELLSKSIDSAKSKSEINIDSSISLNKQKQNFISILNELNSIKPSERIIRGTGYKFNTDGNQVSYNYDIKEVITIDFDRNAVKAITKRLRNEVDEVSNYLDKMQVNLEVDYNPIYDLNDSFEDALNTFISTK